MLPISDAVAFSELCKLIHLREPLPTFDSWSVQYDLALLLAMHVVKEKPHVVMEAGSGISTLILAYALEQIGGKLISLEHDYGYYTRTREHVALHGLKNVELHLCPLIPYTIKSEGYRWYDFSPLKDETFAADFLFVDGPPGYTQVQARYPALPLLKPYLATGATIYLDDADRADERAIISRWCDEYALDSTLLHTRKGCAVLTPYTARR